MKAVAVPPIGQRVRAERVRQGRTVRGLAREVGVSASLISQIETGKSQPSVSTLYAITNALGISIEALFAGPAEPHDPSESSENGHGATVDVPHAPTREAQLPSAVLWPAANQYRTFGVERSRRVGPVVTPDECETLTLDSGVTWELLGQVPGSSVEFLRVTYPPGSTSSGGSQLMRHPGIEYGYLVSGELVLTLAFEEHHIRAGDAFSLSSTTPHAYRNDGGETAVGIWFQIADVVA